MKAKTKFSFLLLAVILSFTVYKLQPQIKQLFNPTHDVKVEEMNKKAKEQIKGFQAEIDKTKAKGDLSKHDQWYIGHMEKMIAHVEKMNRVSKSVSKVTSAKDITFKIGMTVFFIFFVYMMYIHFTSPDEKLTEEELKWTKIPIDQIQKLHLIYEKAPDLSSSSSGYTNFVTQRLFQLSDTLMVVKMSQIMKAIILLMTIGSSGFLVSEFYFIFKSFTEADFHHHIQWGAVVTPSIFTVIGLFLWLGNCSNIRFDLKKGSIFYMNEQAQLVEKSISSVHSIQINSFLQTTSKGHSQMHYQIQLNFNQDGSFALFNHAGKEQAYVDAIKLSLFLNKPLVHPVLGVEKNPHFI